MQRENQEAERDEQTHQEEPERYFLSEDEKLMRMRRGSSFQMKAPQKIQTRKVTRETITALLHRVRPTSTVAAARTHSASFSVRSSVGHQRSRSDFLTTKARRSIAGDEMDAFTEELQGTLSDETESRIPVRSGRRFSEVSVSNSKDKPPIDRVTEKLQGWKNDRRGFIKLDTKEEEEKHDSTPHRPVKFEEEGKQGLELGLKQVNLKKLPSPAVYDQSYAEEIPSVKLPPPADTGLEQESGLEVVDKRTKKLKIKDDAQTLLFKADSFDSSPTLSPYQVGRTINRRMTIGMRRSSLKKLEGIEHVAYTAETRFWDHLPYDFALILNYGPGSWKDSIEELDQVGNRQMEVVQRLIEAGLEVTVMCSTISSRDYICLLLRPYSWRLAIERRRLTMERWLELGAIGEVPVEIETLVGTTPIDEGLLSSDYTETPADRIQAVGRILSSSTDREYIDPPGAGINLDDNSMNDSIITACFALHDRNANDRLMALMTQSSVIFGFERTPFSSEYWFKMKQKVKRFIGISDPIPDLPPNDPSQFSQDSTQTQPNVADADKWKDSGSEDISKDIELGQNLEDRMESSRRTSQDTINSRHGSLSRKLDPSREFFVLLRHYYGERVAIYFHFISVYTRSLVLPAMLGAIFYLFVRWTNAIHYFRGLALFGFLVATIWSPWCLVQWERRNTKLKHTCKYYSKKNQNKSK